MLNADCVTLDNGQVSGTLYSYGLGAVITDTKEYDYGLLTSACNTSPIPTRETKTTYQSFAATPIFTSGPSIFDRRSAVQVYSGSRLMSETDYAYDVTALAAVNATGHDNGNYPASYTNRGNVTTKTQKCFVDATACTNSAGDGN